MRSRRVSSSSAAAAAGVAVWVCVCVVSSGVVGCDAAAAFKRTLPFASVCMGGGGGRYVSGRRRLFPPPLPPNFALRINVAPAPLPPPTFLKAGCYGSSVTVRWRESARLCVLVCILGACHVRVSCALWLKHDRGIKGVERLEFLRLKEAAAMPAAVALIQGSGCQWLQQALAAIACASAIWQKSFEVFELTESVCCEWREPNFGIVHHTGNSCCDPSANVMRPTPFSSLSHPIVLPNHVATLLADLPNWPLDKKDFFFVVAQRAGDV